MPSEHVARRLVAVLAADMVGFSRLMGLDEDGTLDRQKRNFSELFLPKIEEYEGRLIKTTGDGFLAEFPSAIGAVLCAVHIQRAMPAREAGLPAERRLQYRMGINLGDVIHDGEDIFGDGVNVAVRLEAMAEPGGIRISDSVFRTVMGKLDLGFADMGRHRVKNIAEPISAYQVLMHPEDAGVLVALHPLNRPAIRRALLSLLALAVILGTWAFLPDQEKRLSAPVAKRLLVLPFRALDADAELYGDRSRKICG